MTDLEKREKAYLLMREVRLIAEDLGCDITEYDFSILDKIDEKVEVTDE